MRDKKNIIIAVISVLLFFAYNLSYSQTNNETVPVFILQGTVKLKGKPVNGVSLSLLKDGKQLAKIITPRNGLYYFQLNKSDTDPKIEYQLNIEKEGIATGVLKVNTYTPKEQFTVVPYMFNLDFNLTVPDNSGIIKKRDFGKIRWMADKNVFDFDKEYELTVEQEIKKADSVKQAAEQALLTKKEEESKSKADTIASETTETTTGKAISTTTTQADSSIKKEFKDVTKQRVSETEAEKKTATTTIQENSSEKTTTKKESKDIIKESGNNSVIQKTNKEEKSVSIAGEPGNQKKTTGNNKNQTSAEKVVATMVKGEKEKSQEIYKKDITNKKIVEQEKNKINETPKANSGTINNLTGSKINTGALKNTSSSDSLSASDTKEKDLFFLTGIPMEQFRRNLSSPDVNKKADSFEADDVFFANNERSRLLNAKQRMERKKGENLAKKHETNNTLTSLMDMVEEFDKHNK